MTALRRARALAGLVPFLLAGSALAGPAPLQPAPLSQRERPDWCREGYVCERDDRARAMAEEVSALRARVADLEAEASEARQKARGPLGWCLGGGVGLMGEGVRTEPSGAFALEWHAGAMAGVVYGWRPRR